MSRLTVISFPFTARLARVLPCEIFAAVLALFSASLDRLLTHRTEDVTAGQTAQDDYPDQIEQDT